MKTLDILSISFENGATDVELTFDSLMIDEHVQNELLNNQDLSIIDDFDFSKIRKMQVNDELTIATDEGDVFLKRIQREEVEEWYEILSDKLTDAGIKHKVAATGTIYIQFGDYTLRIADHDPNGSGKVDLDADKIEDNFDAFVDALESNDIDNVNEFIY